MRFAPLALDLLYLIDTMTVFKYEDKREKFEQVVLYEEQSFL